MMKRIVVLLIALVFSSIASAAHISLVDEGNYTAPPEPFTTKLEITTTDTLIGLDVIFTVTGGAIFTGAMSSADAADYGWDAVGFPIDPIGVGTAQVEIGGTTFGVCPGGIVGYVEVYCPLGFGIVSIAPGEAFGGSTDCSTFEPATFSDGVVTIIPEPLTIALLGLGGLFLGRRK